MKQISFNFSRIFFILFLLVVSLGISCANSIKESTQNDQIKLMWLDATANIQRFNNKDTIDYYLTKLKDLGFTDVVVDMRPISGYVMYDSDIAPKLNSWRGDTIVWTFDYMGYYIEKGHSLGLNIQASLNVFVAGHNFFDKGIIYEQDKAEWSTMVYNMDGAIVPITDMKEKYSAMVNPSNQEYQTYIISIFKELIRKYPDLDGLIMDRVRYDGYTADFSDITRKQFEEYLGEKLDNYPADVYEWRKDELGNDYPHKGKYYMQWLQWRSQNIHDFMVKAREEVKLVNPDISFGTYTGAWYPTYFEVGVNFASKEYDPSKEFDWATPEYKNTGYAELMDLFTVGNYYTTVTKEDYLKVNPQIQNETDMEAQSSIWYCVEGSNENLRRILGDNKFLGGILVDQFNDNHEGLTESIKMNLATSDGLMVFDIVHIINKDMWDAVEKGMREANVIE